MMARALRDDLHLRLAEHMAMLADASPEEVAQHYEYAGRGREAADWYARATVAAANLGDAPRTLACADKALELGTPRAKWFELQMARSEALEMLGRLQEQGRALDAALATAADDGQRARALTNRAVCHFRLGRREDAIRVAEEAALSARGSGDAAVLATARGRQAVVLAYSGEVEAASAALDEAEAVAPEGASDIATSLSLWRAQLSSVTGDLAERRAAYQRAIAGYEAAGDLRRAAGAEMNLADVANRVGAYSEAESALRAALGKLRRLGNRLMEGYALLNLGYALTRLRERDEAISTLEETIQIAEETGESRLALGARIYLAQALTRLDSTRAEDEAHRAASEAREAGFLQLAALGLATAGYAAVRSGDGELALTRATEAMAIRDQLGGLEEDEGEIFAVYARALDFVGRSDEAAEVRARGRRRIAEIASRISDEALRERFSNDVRAHQSLAK
jgi:tetratricopeptide (TPR) repeat protein